MLKYHIQTIEVGSGGAGSISFNNIPQEYDDLILTISGRNNSTALADSILPTINGSTSGFSGRLLYGVGSGSGVSVSLARYFGTLNGGTSTASTFSSTTVTIPNYKSSASKSFSVDSVTETNGTTIYQYLYAGLWANTSPITSISIASDIANSATLLVQGSSASLYGIKRGDSKQLTAATGGTVTTSGGYTYHTFTSSGTFASSRQLDVDVLVVAGGGSGGGYDGGGGGAGGYLAQSIQLPASPYAVTVGAGGSGTFNTRGNNGSNSVFSTLTSIGGGTGAVGGGGSTNTGNGGIGGSGGGGGSSTGNLLGGAGTSGQGFAGGNSSGMSGDYGSGGGGGAGGAGESPAATTGGGHGGAGIQWINGAYYAAGGGGANGNAYGSSIPGTGGIGGGGNGALHNMADGAVITPATSGSVNTGSGGGGGGIAIGSQANGANGGSGIVIIRYLTPA